jgi:hypothetical protein
MSLTVSADLLDQAKAGKVSETDFLDCIRSSLPFAWDMVTRLVEELRSTGQESAQNTQVPPDDEAWGQMFRMMASDSMRNAIQRHFGVRLAFQNCCKPAVFKPEAEAAYAAFIAPEAQLLNQDPSLVNC